MQNIVEEQGKGYAKHAARVRLFQILCALDREKDRKLSQEEIESRFEELFVIPENVSAALQLERDAEEDEAAYGPVPFQDFRDICAQAVKINDACLEIDKIIERHSTEWKTARMSLVDRTAIRIAVYEAFIARKVSVPVALSEAVLIAKEFSGDVSGRFVNGVLARIAKAEPK